MDILKIEGVKELFSYPCKVSSPLAVGQAYYCATENGDILKYTDSQKEEIMFTILGCPSSIAYWNLGNSFLIADFAHQSIFKRDEQEVEQIHNLITEFNDKAFHGPSSLTISETTRRLFFTDSGTMGETSIQNKLGSLFMYKFEDKSLIALALRQLAEPCGIVMSSDNEYLLVCEKGQNRILKFIIGEHYSGNYTVFHQFSGRVGPSSICRYNRFYFASLFEFKELSKEGVVAVLNDTGDLLEKIILPMGPQITGLTFLTSGEDPSMVMLATERNKLYQIKFKGEKGESQEQSELNEVSLSHKK